MRPIDRREVMSLADYETIRDRFRQRVIAGKRGRRAKLGPLMSVMFENRDTVLLQIQEMLRTERITKEAGIAHEIDTYNELVPGERQLSMTLFVEIDEKEERERMLVALAGMEERVSLDIDGVRVPAREVSRAGQEQGRTTAVHYYKIDLPAELGDKLGARKVSSAAVVVDHPAYAARAELSEATVAELAGDLTWSD